VDRERSTSGVHQNRTSTNTSRSAPHLSIITTPHSKHSPHFPSNWRTLAKDDLIDSCRNLIDSIDRSPSSKKLLILFVLLQSSYLLQYFIHNGILHALNEWIKTHPVRHVVPWHFKILRQTNWERVFVNEVGGMFHASEKRFRRSDELIQTIYDIFQNRHREDLLLSTKAFSVLKRLLPPHELASWIGEDWRRLVKMGLQSKVSGRRLVANNVLHTLKRYDESDDWNMQHSIVRLAYDNFDEEETLKAIENLANTARRSFEEVMLAGGFKLCLDNLDHSRQRIRNHVLLLLRILCENAPHTFLIYPFNMGMVSKMAPYIKLREGVPHNNVANAFHIIVSILKRSEFNNHSRVQEFHMVHSQIAAQDVLSINFEEYTESVQDLIVGAGTCLYLALYGSTERSSYSLNHGMLERIVFYVNRAPHGVFASLLSLIAPLCASKLSTEVLFQESPSVANQVIEVLRRHVNDEDHETRAAARASLQRVAFILGVDTYRIFDEYIPSSATFRHMSIPEDIVERTRKVQGFLQTRSTSARDTALYIKKLSLKRSHKDKESELIDTFRRADNNLNGKRPASAILAQPKQYALSQKARIAQRVQQSTEETRRRDNTIRDKADFISSLLDDSRVELRRVHEEKIERPLKTRPFSAGVSRPRTKEPTSTGTCTPQLPSSKRSLGGRQRPSSAKPGSKPRIHALKHENLISIRRTTDPIDRSKSRYSCADPLHVDNAYIVDSPPFPDEMAALEKKRQRLKREQQANALYNVTTLDDIDSIVVQKRARNGYSQSQAQLLRLCTFCGNASFQVVYKCFTCDLIFCSSDCRHEALNSFHAMCSKKKTTK